MTLDQALHILRRNKPLLEERFGVQRIGVFGSMARDEAGERSDVDVVVDMPPDLFGMVHLKALLEEDLGVSVDLIRRRAHAGRATRPNRSRGRLCLMKRSNSRSWSKCSRASDVWSPPGSVICERIKQRERVGRCLPTSTPPYFHASTPHQSPTRTTSPTLISPSARCTRFWPNITLLPRWR